MKIAAIIAEYNPFHNGHKYHIEQTRAVTGSTHVVAVMSGNFTQRGDIAVAEKHKRAETALRNGADLIIELPVAFSLSSAERFASGAVSLLNSLNCADVLSFGSECGDAELIKEAAGAAHYAVTTEDFIGAVKSGLPYPAALQKTVGKYYTDDVVRALNEPNNILGVEYVKALNEIGSSIEPFTITRGGAAHDGRGEGAAANGVRVLSALQLRKMIFEGGDVSAFMPDAGDLGDYADIRRLETAVLVSLRLMSPAAIKRAPNVQNGLENRIYKAARAARSLPELYFLAKTKSYTMARIRRAVLCCFLGITKSDAKLPPQYVRILGMNEKGREILAAAKCELPMDTSLAALMKRGDGQKRQALLEERCANVYALAFGKRRICGGEFTAKPVIL
ncbi:MAG: nucleotidyltransferase family protein [Oscillospiraceae bacterium]|jgi:predicted nucleotidyltransferase|nr:nucleotidyltransferase family protein [Oscillospiraceae bacterium]